MSKHYINLSGDKVITESQLFKSHVRVEKFRALGIEVRTLSCFRVGRFACILAGNELLIREAYDNLGDVENMPKRMIEDRKAQCRRIIERVQNDAHPLFLEARKDAFDEMNAYN